MITPPFNHCRLTMTFSSFYRPQGHIGTTEESKVITMTSDTNAKLELRFYVGEGEREQT